MLVVRRIAGVVRYIKKIPVLQVSIAVIAGSILPWWMCILAACVLVALKVTGVIRLSFWIGFLVIGIRLVLVSGSIQDGHISEWNGERVRIRSIVTSDLSVGHENVGVAVSAREVCEIVDGDVCDSWEATEGKFRTWLPRYPKIREGDVLILEGKLEEPEEFVEGTFSYIEYLEGREIYSVMYRPIVEYSGEQEIWPPFRLIVDFREYCIGKINRMLPEPHSSLLAGMLLGVRKGMPEEFSEALQRTGTTHVIAASGYNVTVVVQAVFSSLSFLHRKLRIWLSMGAIWVFVVLAGASPPVVRAGVMGSISLLGMVLGRMSVVHVGLPLSAAVMIVADPGMISDLGFQLSFVSTCGLVYLVPVLRRLLPWIPDWLEDSTLVTVSAVIATLPLIMYSFGRFSLIAPVANFLVLPVISVVMGVGVVLILVPAVLNSLAVLVGSIVWVPLEYFNFIISKLSSVSFASIDVKDMPEVWVVLSYIALGIGVLIWYQDDSRHNILPLRV